MRGCKQILSHGNKLYIVFILILILAAFLRFYKFSEIVNFDFDQEYAANFAYSVIKEYPIQLIGQGLSIQGLFMGPLYFYYLVPFFALTNLHPLGGFIGSILFSLSLIITYFFVAKSIFGFKAALVVAFLRSVLYIELGNDLAMTPAFHSELLVLITWYIFYKYWHGSTNLFPYLGLTFGLFTSIHPILFPFYLTFLILLFIKRRLPNFRVTLISIITFILPISPLLLFEYFHKFLEVKRLLELFTGLSLEHKTNSQLIHYINFNLNEPNRILGLQFIPKELFLILFFIIMSYLILKRISFWRDNFHTIMITITYFVFIGYYHVYPAHVPEYYFIALTTLAIFYIGASLSLLLKKRLSSVILFLLLLNIFVINLKQLESRWNNQEKEGLKDKDFIVKEIIKRQPKDQEFYVSYIKLPGWNFGFDYLFKLYGHKPQTREAKPPVYTIVIPKSLSPDSIDISSHNIGLILPK